VRNLGQPLALLALAVASDRQPAGTSASRPRGGARSRGLSMTTVTLALLASRRREPIAITKTQARRRGSGRGMLGRRADMLAGTGHAETIPGPAWWGRA
jgi:hypothetical protein